MPGWLFWSIVAGYFVIAVALVFWLPNCRCGKARRGFLRVNHPPLPILCSDAIYFTVLTVLCLLYIDYGAVWFGALGAWHWLRVYYHEKNKIKRAAKAAGRVVVTDTGRLAVER